MACTWLSAVEASEYLRVDKTTLYKWIKDGRIQASQPGGKIYKICLEELQRFMQAEVVKPL